jgi:hypothetical protein
VALKRSWLALALGVWLSQAWADCHIHVPDDYPNFGSKPLVIPVSGNRSACQSLNLSRFGGRGRCHCADDLSLQPRFPAEPGGPDGAESVEMPPYLP